MAKRILEICVGSYLDAIEAYNAGADRLELNQAMSLGGLSPNLSCLILLKKKIKIPIIVMLRHRPAGFSYTEKEFEYLRQEASMYLEHGADGLAFGFLNDDLSINEAYTSEIIKLIKKYDKEAVFHRAFDLCKDQNQALIKLADMGIDRILTSGGRANIDLGFTRLKELQELKKQKHLPLTLLAGAGLNEENLKRLIKETDIMEFHSSAKAYLTDTTTLNEHVNFSYINNTCSYESVDKNLIKRFKEIVNSKPLN